MKRMIILTTLLMGIIRLSLAQGLEQFEKQWYIQDGDTMPYRVLYPEHYDPAKAYPLLIFLHGRGESGSDNEKQLVHGATLFLRDSIRRSFPAIVVFPQCAKDSYWSNVGAVVKGAKNGKRSFYFVSDGPPTAAMKLLLSLTENLFVQYKINSSQVYVMGLSMGGMGTFELVRRKPALFAAAIAICGGAHPATAPAMKKTNWWIFHGAKDDVVLPAFSETMATALKKAGAKVKYTVYPNANHNSWDPAFAEPGLLNWLFLQQRKH